MLMPMALKLDRSKLVKNLVKGYKLTPHLEKALDEMGDFEWTFTYTPKVFDDGWHPSSSCVASVHDLWQEAKGGREQNNSATMMKYSAVGHFWHAYLQELCVRAELCDRDAVERHETKRWGEGAYHYVSGSGDFAPMKIPGWGDWLVDVKTMKEFDFKQNHLPKWCAAKYQCQINIYMDLFDLDESLILCVQKDSPHSFKEFAFKRNQPLIDAIYHKWHLVSEHLDAGTEPDPDLDVELPL